jgi:hypothetical protein
MYVVSELDVERWSEETPPAPLVKKVDLGNLRGLEATNDAFLPNFVGLLDVDLSFISTLRRIGKSFLFRCNCLTHIDLTPLRSVTSIGPNFLHGCSGITDLDLRPLHRLKSIPNGFLQGCTALTRIDLKHLSHVNSIGPHFLSGCTSLGPSLDLTPLSEVMTLGPYFLANCTSLASLDVSPILSSPRLMHPVGDHFLERCSGLVTVTLPSGSAPNPPRVIGSHFLQGCLRLSVIDLSFFHSVEQVGGHFLHGCCALTNVDLGPFERSLRAIGGSFLYGCSGLDIVDLTPLQQLRVIGNYFLIGSSPKTIFTDDRPILIDALRCSALLDKCCIAGHPYVASLREKLLSYAETVSRQQRSIESLESEAREGRVMRAKLESLQREHEVLVALHSHVSADADAMREQLEAVTRRAEAAEARARELQEAKAKVQAKYSKIRDCDLNAKLHDATLRLGAMDDEYYRVCSTLKQTQAELSEMKEATEKHTKEFGSVGNMARELEACKETIAKSKAIQSEGLKKLQELHSRLKTEMESKNQLQARFQKLQQEMQQRRASSMTE